MVLQWIHLRTFMRISAPFNQFHTWNAKWIKREGYTHFNKSTTFHHTIKWWSFSTAEKTIIPFEEHRHRKSKIYPQPFRTFSAAILCLSNVYGLPLISRLLSNCYSSAQFNVLSHHYGWSNLHSLLLKLILSDAYCCLSRVKNRQESTMLKIQRISNFKTNCSILFLFSFAFANCVHFCSNSLKWKWQFPNGSYWQ